MLEKGRISSRQLILMLVTTVVATDILTVPAIVARESKQDGWISVLVLATAYGAIVAAIIAALARRFPTQTLIEYCETILGRWLGKITGLLFITWFIYIGGGIMRSFGEFMLIAFMPETPLVVLSAFVLILAAVTVRNGVEVIARVNTLTAMTSMSAFLAIIVLVAQDMNPATILPLLEQGLKPVIAGSITSSAFRGELIVGAMLLPYVNQQLGGRRAAHWANLMIALILTVDVLANFFVLGPLTALSTFPTLEIARYVSIGRFVERFEVLVMIFWVAGVMVKFAIFYYATVLGTAQLFNVREYRPLVFPIGIILLVLSLIEHENIIELISFLGKLFPVYGPVFETALPLFLLLAAVLLGKKEPLNK